MRAVLIINPASGESMLAETEGKPQEHEQLILAALQANGIEAEVRHTTLEDPGAGLAAEAAAAGADIVIAAGGDGTVHEVAGGLIGTRSTLGIIALGTMNNLAHSLNIPETVEEACATIANGQTISIDAGKINDHYFTEVAGIGLEAALFPAAEEFKSPGLLSTIRGVVDGFRILLAFKPAKLRISIDAHRRRPYHAIQVTICNSRYYGPHFQLVPDALMDDGLLDVVIFKNFSKLEYLRHAVSISQGRRVYQPKIIHRRVKSLRVEADHPVEIQADGLPHGLTPAVVTVVPGALRIRVPQAVADVRQAPEPHVQASHTRQQHKPGQRAAERGPINVK